jgi:Sec-independent protein translocase protein TatA
MQDLPTDVHILSFSGGEMLFLLVGVLILFLSSRIPNFAEGLRRAFREFLKASRDIGSEFDQAGFDAGQNLGGIYGKPAAEALTIENTNVELYDPDALHEDVRVRRVSGWEKRKQKNARTTILLFIAGGFVFGVVAYRLYKSLYESFQW